MNLVYLYKFESIRHFYTRPRPPNIVRPLFSPIQDDNGLKSRVFKTFKFSRSRS